MRMWMCDPKIMCTKHLLGEHVETHMFLGTLKQKKKMDGYIKNDLLEIKSLEERHKDLVHEMNRRGMKHNSLLCVEYDHYEYLPDSFICHTIDKDNSFRLLIERCPECKRKSLELKLEEACQKNSR